ncbi:hypothetical protein MMC20_001151 [Loxospora ochrophaea]|nr:hypothetical protein [Loxospora ochrophaea]
MRSVDAIFPEEPASNAFSQGNSIASLQQQHLKNSNPRPSPHSKNGVTHVERSTSLDESLNALPSTIPESNLSRAQALSTSQPEPSPYIRHLRRKRMSSAGSQGGADTQPISQSVYDLYINQGGAGFVSEGGVDFAGGVQVHGPSPHSRLSDNTPQVDLLGAFDQPSVAQLDVQSNTQHGDDADGFSQVDVRAEIYPESQRFRLPKTPATNGTKRYRNGEAVERGGTTPRLPLNPFVNDTPGNNGIMNLSQVFKATQAPSSPFINQLNSEATQERPSPDVFTRQRPLTSDGLSSPVKSPYANTHRSTTEPHTTYIPMKESQAERERRRQSEKNATLSGHSNGHDFSDDDFDHDDELQKRLNRQKIDKVAMNQFAGITAPARPSSRVRGRPGLRKPLLKESPLRSAKPVVISDDVSVEDDRDNTTEDETDHGENHEASEPEEPDELGDSNKENVRVTGVQVPMTTSRKAAHSRSARASQESTPSKWRRLNPLMALDQADELAEDQEDSSGFSENTQKALVRGQAVAIADSQPSQSRQLAPFSHPSTAAGLVAPASSPGSRTFIPQSQIPLQNDSQHSSSTRARAFENRDLPFSSDPPAIPSHPVSHTPNRAEKSRRIPHIDQNLSQRVSQSNGEHSGSTGTDPNSSPPQIRKFLQSPQEGERLGHYEDLLAEPENKDVEESREVCNVYNVPSADPVVSTQGDINSSRSNEQMARSQIDKISALDKTIPNTSSASNDTGHPLSTGTTTFETAQMHMNVSPSKSSPQHGRGQSEPVISPPKQGSGRVKTFGEIAADPSPPDVVGDIDVDIGLVTNDDVEYQNIISGSSPIGPIRKKRRGHFGRALHARALNSDELSPASQPPSEVTADKPGGLAEVMENDARALSSSSHRRDLQIVPNAESSSTLNALSKGTNHPEVRGHQTANNASPDNEEKSAHNQSSPTRVPELAIAPKNNPVDDDLADNHTTVELLDPEDVTSITSHTQQIVAPNRVFALYSGSSIHGYYTATCIGTSHGSNPSFKVRFDGESDDDNVAIVRGDRVRRLELRIGDLVKVDERGKRKDVYTVQGFKGQTRPARHPTLPTPRHTGKLGKGSALDPLQTDVHGYDTVIISIKPKESGVGNAAIETHELPLHQIYLTRDLWSKFGDRDFNYFPVQPTSRTGLQTPSEQFSAPSSPSSRTNSLRNSVLAHPISKSLATARNGSSLFENMVFTVTNVDNRQTVERDIAIHGGELLEHNFTSLFHIPGYEPTSPSKRASIQDLSSFRLTREAARLGFACLIADKHCRTAKYIQALALGIPCLATRWVRDCIEKQKIVPWEPYLLPSGDSAFLHGAVRSRLLPSFPPESVNLATVMASRPQFLAGSSVLLIKSKSKANEIMKGYSLIAHALGASTVTLAPSLETGRKALVDSSEVVGNDGGYDWVCFDDGGDQAEKMSEKQVCSALFGDEGSSSSSKKRKRSAGVVVAARGKTRVVGTDFLIQSLILGQLMDC